MTSLSSISGQSPRAMMDARISAATAAGKISTTDQTALESALDSIDSSISSGGSAQSGGDIRGKVDSLIGDQVSSGALTADQAKELQAFFATGGPQGAPPPPAGGEQADTATDVSGTKGGHHCHMGPPPAASTVDTDSDAADTTSATDTEDIKLQALMAFLQQLRTNEQQQSGVYGGPSSASSSGKLVSALA